MSFLFDEYRHTPLLEEAWLPQQVQDEIALILEDIVAAQQADHGWPMHPLDMESYPSSETKWALYCGAAGVIIATEILRKARYDAPDLRRNLPAIYQNYLKDPDVSAAELGLQIGELGILTPAILSDLNNNELRERADACMSLMIDHPAYEITSGQTGMMHAALSLYEATNDERWKAHYLNGAEALWSSWTEAREGDGWFWQSEIFGQKRSYLGACHGVVGNMGALLRGAELLPADWISTALERTVMTLDAYAVRSSRKANWSVCKNSDKSKLLVHWCHGAPGIVTALREAPGGNPGLATEIDQILREASMLVWEAGPLAKGPGLCHGTAGNGYTFLTMYRRDGEVHWLEKARAFAMHAIRQCQESRKKFTRGRYSLMTGDAGLAVYLHHCLHPDDVRFPGLEIFS
ncbi:MAG: LanC-like protein [Sneathiella sp.]